MDFQSNNKKFQIVVCGGTFDHLHKGHKKLLEHGLSASERLIIGVTSDEFVNKFKIKNLKLKIKSQNSKFENYSLRKKNLENFLRRITKDRYEILEIGDIFGPTLDGNFQADAIILTKNTKPGAEKINEERVKRNLSQFKIIISSQILAEDGQPISSFRIRNGEIDRKGKLFIKPVWLKDTLVLPQNIRGELKKPLGSLIDEIDKEKIKNCTYLITVGDETTKIFNSLSLKSNIAVVDFKIARIKQFSDLKELGFLGTEEVTEIKNPSGHITPELFNTFAEVFKKQKKDHLVIKIDGEDDLAVLPLILSAPLGSCIFYGQPDQGLVYILIDEEIKNKAYQLVSSFSTRGY